MVNELQQLNHESTLTLWAERIAECRNSSLTVTQWCKENNVCVQTYYRWQKKLFAMAQTQQESRFAEITPVSFSGNIAVTLRMAGMEAAIHNGADPATIKTVLQGLKIC